jgi:hypothetical protein
MSLWSRSRGEQQSGAVKQSRADSSTRTARRALRDAFRMVLTVRSGVEWVMGLGHISAADHATGGGASRIQHHPPSRMTQSRLRSAQNTCGVTDWCVSRSIHPDPRKRKITIK